VAHLVVQRSASSWKSCAARRDTSSPVSGAAGVDLGRRRQTSSYIDDGRAAGVHDDLCAAFGLPDVGPGVVADGKLVLADVLPIAGSATGT
jgi:hypothetical protein